MQYDRVLIVEDDAVTARLISGLLERNGYRSIVRSSAEEAWQVLCESSDVSLLITDWMLPGLSGAELIEKIRAEIRDRYVYTILITARGEDSNLSKVAIADADDFMVKPILTNELLGRLRVASRIVRLQADLERQRAELLAQHVELEKFQYEKSSLLHSIPLLLITCDSSDTVSSWNEVAESIFSIPSNDAIGRSFLSLDISWNWSRLLVAMAEASDSKLPKQLSEVRFRSGQDTLFLDLTVSSINDLSGIRIGTLILGDNVTQRRHMAQELERARKLESIGQLASGISHEINTPMQFIGDNVQWVFDSIRKVFITGGLSQTREELRDSRGRVLSVLSKEEMERVCGEIPRALEQTLDGIDRVVKIVRAMKDFSHPGQSKEERTELERLVDSTLIVSRNVWKHCATIEKQLDPEMSTIRCFPGELSQVLLNLIVNSAHAIEERKTREPQLRGKIVVRARRVDEWCEISVGDNGSGIPAEIQPRVFEPFFTTKEVGRGTGQGLSMSHSIITQLHGGTLTFDSDEQEGSTFIIRIPLEIAEERAAREGDRLTSIACVG